MNNKIQTTKNPNDISTNTLNIFDKRYYSVNKYMLSFLGLWPYQSNLEKRIKFCVLLFLSSSGMIPQIRMMVFTWGRLDKFVECFSPLGTHIACDIKLINMMMQQWKLRKLLDETRQDWESMENSKHTDIIKEFAENGRRWSILWVSIVYAVVSGWLIMALTPKILDIFVPLNHSRRTFDVVASDYGIDPVKYWWPINVHVWSVVPVILLIMPAVDALYMCFAQHACGMFGILRCNLGNILKYDGNINVILKPSNYEDYYYQENEPRTYNLENIFESGDNRNVTLKPNYHDDHCYQEIVACIKKHKHLVQYVKDIQSTYETCLLIILGMNMIGLSITGYQAVAKDSSLEDTIRFALFNLAILLHLLITTLPGHWIMSSSAFLPDFAFYSKWYLMSLRSRKLIILIIRASIKPCSLTAGKIYVLSMSNFCGVLKTSMSYLAMLTSIQ